MKLKIGICSFGYNFIKVNDEIIIGGIILRDVSFGSEARTKRLRTERSKLVTKDMLERAVESIQTIGRTLQETVEAEKKRLIEEYSRKHMYETDFLEPLREEIQRGLSFIHDYKQINTQISHNINVIIETRYTGDSFQDKLTKATREEKAIYESSKFLDEKLIVAKFLMHPEWLDIKSECRLFRFHGVVYKYLGIYTQRFNNKNVIVTVDGQSYSDINANPQAVSVIVHTLLDNAAKYSPMRGKVEIYVQDDADGIEFAVSSYGPRILPKEREKIFSPFYRGECARRDQEEGAGYGLYISQFIAEHHLGTRIMVCQDDRQTPQMGHWTTFSLRIPLKAAILF